MIPDDEMDGWPSLDTPGATFRQRRWEDLGCPDADHSSLSFIGPDAQRLIVIDALARLPPAARHFAVEAVTWFGIEDTAKAWGAWLPSRVLPGEAGHVIVCRRIDLGTVAHELAHRYHATPRESAPKSCGLSAASARALLVPPRGHVDRDSARDAWVVAQIEHELLADRQAEEWGIPHRGLSALQLAHRFFDLYDAAERTADDVDETAQ